MSYDDSDAYSPTSFSFTKRHDIQHYYGDYVRMLFLVSAVLSTIAIPVFGDLLPFGTLAQVGSALLLVLLAGLTNPHSNILLWYNTVISGLGVLLLESAAISFYATQSFALFASREATAIALLFAFYFSVKTLRAMSLGKLGRPDQAGEFTNPE